MSQRNRVVRAGVVVGLLVVACWGQLAGAVMIAAGDGSGNTTSPSDLAAFSDFQFWGNVGLQSSGSAVYLGNNWVLTAAHINGTSSNPTGVTLNGQFFSRDASTATVVLTNPDGGLELTSHSDLKLFRVNETPVGLPAVTLATAGPNVDDEVLMIGHGTDRDGAEMFWDADGQPSTAPTAIRGFAWATSRSERWGTNTVDQAISRIRLGGSNGDVRGYTTVFDRFGGTGFEAQAGGGDSGGGVFVRGNDGWELAGLIHAISPFLDTNQQQVEAAIFSSATFISDLSLYRDQIVAVIPEPTALGLWTVALLAFAPRRQTNR